MELPLEGIKVIDFTGVQAGPRVRSCWRGSAPMY